MGSTVFWYTYYIMVDLRHWGYPEFEVFILAAHFPDNRLDLRGDGTVSVLLDTTISASTMGPFSLICKCSFILDILILLKWPQENQKQKYNRKPKSGSGRKLYRWDD